MEKLLGFDFKVQYVSGEDNVLPNAVLCLYEFDALSRLVLPNRELMKGGSVITSGCQQCARAMKL